jgi:arabinofuranan 3-O-arabinosyltransferase
VLLAVLAYLPSLTARPGKMPADTKLYLYLDPGRSMADAPFTFDGRQFAGWVPHQTISYLWPSGPWYWLLDTLGVPDWVAHRLWIGTVLFLAGLGAWWAARVLGLGLAGALAAAAVYQLSPYVLPYLSRTSLMLLPFAGLGWLVALTVRAATTSRWRHAALFALVVATVGAPNATAIAMIAPAPIVWLAHAAWSRAITWRHALVTASKIGALCIGVSLWWLSMLSVQSRVGADVLAYSETLEAVSLTSTSTETLRGMGYWLFYVRDPVGFTTSATFDYLASARVVMVSFVLPVLGLLGMSIVRFPARRFAILLVAVGIVLAVGVHPIADPAPLFSPFAEESRSTLVLALRSSTRALPMSVLGLALGVGALVAAAARRWHRLQLAGPLLVVAIAVVNVPAMRNDGFVDPVLTRDEDPPQAWLDAAAALDAGNRGARVLQVPGQEFGAFRWGYTVDPPLPGLTDRPLVTRDLLPLGSPAAMDLLYALDDRFQEGVAERAALAPVARLLGADTIWLTNDAWFDRFRTPRPETIAPLIADGGDGLDQPTTFGAAVPNVEVVESTDETKLGDVRVGMPLEPVWLARVDDAPGVIRVKNETVLLVGAGDGVVDAAAAGVLDGSEALVYASAPVDDASAPPTRVVITDSNRDRARQWRGSQDVVGFTETGGPSTDLLRRDTADQRLPVFATDGADSQTVAEQRGPVTAVATAYGEPFAYRPESRAAMAIDGRLDTAWVVAERWPAVGEAIELTTAEPIASLRLVQPATRPTGVVPDRWITAVDLVLDGERSQAVSLDDSSRTTGQTVMLDVAASTVRISIAATTGGRDAVGFAEIDTGLGPTTEVVRPPIDWTAPAGTALDVVLTRVRTDPADRWRADPEPVLRRAVRLPAAATFDLTVTARIDRRASDSVLADLLGVDGPIASNRLTGFATSAGWAALDGDVTTAWTSPFGDAVGQSITLRRSGDEPLTSLTIVQPGDDLHSTITAVAIGDDADAFAVEVPADGVVELPDPLTGGELTVTITEIEPRTTVDRRYAESWVLPVAIAELRGTGLAGTTVSTTFATPCRDDLLTLDGAPVPIRVAGSYADATTGEPLDVEICDGSTRTLQAGERLIEGASGAVTGIDIDRVVLRTTDASPPADVVASNPAVEVIEHTRLHRTVVVERCPQGCWLVVGEGYNTAWEATMGGESLGRPSLLDGGFNGWWLPPGTDRAIVEVRWTAQDRVTGGLLVSLVAVAACAVVAGLDRRRRAVRSPAAARLVGWGRGTPGRRWLPVAVCAASAMVLVGPLWAPPAAAVAVAASWWRRPRLLGLAAATLASLNALVITSRVAMTHPFANTSWPGAFEKLHRPGLLVVVFLLGSLVAGDRPVRTVRRPPSR